MEREGGAGIMKGECGGGGGIVDWVTEDDVSKVDSVLRSVARDWSEEGKEERNVAYRRIVGAVTRYASLPPPSSSGDDVRDGECRRCSSAAAAASRRSDIRIAVPGSGLGRLAWELYSHGFSVEGSDFSLPMLLASDFILNGRCPRGCGGGGGDGCDADSQSLLSSSSSSMSSSSPKFVISPWMAETKNVTSLADRLRTVIVPDVNPGTAANANDHRRDEDDDVGRPEFTMLAGEFLHLYSDFPPGDDGDDGGRMGPGLRDDASHAPRRKFHVVACSYFLDTAPSLPHYLHAIYHMLEYGGLLVHFGPLMYHWSGHGCLMPRDVDMTMRGRGGGRTDDDDFDECHEYDNGGAYDRRNGGLDARYLHSIDYTWEEVRDMILNCGFVILEEERGIPSKYASDVRSMMGVVYGCVFCVARKEERGGGGDKRGE